MRHSKRIVGEIMELFQGSDKRRSPPDRQAPVVIVNQAGASLSIGSIVAARGSVGNVRAAGSKDTLH